MSKKFIKGTSIWIPPGFDLKKSYFLQALEAGVANKEQQQEALKYLVEDLCGTYSDTFDFDSARISDSLQGQRSIGLAIVQICKMRLDKVKALLKPQEDTNEPREN